MMKFLEASPTSMNTDNDKQQTIRIVVAEPERLSTKLRHIDIHQMWLKQEHQKGSFQVTYLETANMPADGLIKVLSRAQFERFRAHLNLRDVQEAINRYPDRMRSFMESTAHGLGIPYSRGLSEGS